jgi:hypothetical protein
VIHYDNKNGGFSLSITTKINRYIINSTTVPDEALRGKN